MAPTVKPTPGERNSPGKRKGNANMYKDPIKVDSNDPLLSATSLEGTVIGILFEKSGEEIKEAIKCRISSIDADIQKNVEMITPIRDFLRDKEALIANIEVYEENRRVDRNEELKPLNKKKEELESALHELQEQIVANGKRFDIKTCEGLKEELKKFKSGWEQIDSHLEELEKEHTNQIWKILSEASIDPDAKGIKDHDGSAAYTSISSSSDSSVSYNRQASTPLNWQAARGEIEVDGTCISYKLRRKVDEYKNMFDIIKMRVNSLVLEKRRLEMISRNISSDRKFKLSLIQLSAFGFEDIEVK